MPTHLSHTSRHRRLRASAPLRDLFREQRLHPHDLIAPLFVTDSAQHAGPIETLPGVVRHHLDGVVDAAGEVAAAGIRAIILFGVPAQKDDVGSGAWDDAGVVARAIRDIRAAGLDLTIVADVCLCQFTSHGHCGVLVNDQVANGPTLELLARTSATYARAGATLVAPSGMMDGGVAAIRGQLDADGFDDVGILAYTVKHASALYGPFRTAVRSAPMSGDRRSYQLDPANGREALREAASDLAEGADALMVKPALTNLDTLVRLRNAHPATPLAAFEVSGEYAMVSAAAARGWLDERAVTLEHLTAIKRAGADLIVTYGALTTARWLRAGAFE